MVRIGESIETESKSGWLRAGNGAGHEVRATGYGCLSGAMEMLDKGYTLSANTLKSIGLFTLWVICMVFE